MRASQASGMFAIAIRDARRRVDLARDPSGKTAVHCERRAIHVRADRDLYGATPPAEIETTPSTVLTWGNPAVHAVRTYESSRPEVAIRRGTTEVDLMPDPPRRRRNGQARPGRTRARHDRGSVCGFG